jgi:UDP-3-O-acyl N-acetylglucosamine deacetylase
VSPRRATVARPVTVEGIGLHLGHRCRLTFRPAPSGTGRVFVRSDRPGRPRLPALAGVAEQAERRTQVGHGEDALHTVEHVLAAVAALEFDDLEMEMDAPEPPVLDGSSQGFVAALREAGRLERDEPAPEFRLREPVRVVDGSSVYEAFPADDFELEVAIDFPHPLVGRQTIALRVTAASFAAELARARTFGFVHEVEALQGMGLIRGGSTENAVVLGPDGVVDNALRWPDEFVRHKALDCVGDLALLGGRVRARVVAERPSHSGTLLLVRSMLAHADDRSPVAR